MGPLTGAECPSLATSGGSGHRLATSGLPPGADISDRTSAFLDFRRLYPQLRTWMAPLVNGDCCRVGPGNFTPSPSQNRT